MDFEVFGARTEIEPLSLLQNDASDFSALSDPISQNWNKRDFLLWRNPRESRRIPNCNVGKIVFARNAIAIRNIDHAIVAKGNCGPQAGVAECEGDIVIAVEMLVDQRSQRNVRPNIAAISEEWFAAQLNLDVFDSAARFKKRRLVDESERFSGMRVFWKRFRESRRQSMGIDKEFVDSDVDQMVEDKRNQRFLKDRH